VSDHPRILIRKTCPEPHPWEFVVYQAEDPHDGTWDALDYGSLATHPEALAAAWQALAEDAAL